MLKIRALRRAPLWLAIAVALYFLYFFGLTRMGLIGPDEARYAAIGRAMAATGDWITPRLWGQAWFEKPALLYWLTASGFKLGLGMEFAPRLPVAVASVAFLVYFFTVLRREFGERAAWYATAILATSAGWLAYSHIAITDLPMSAAFAAAMLAVFSERASLKDFAIAGALLGLAVLGKGLVPLVLFIPALWLLRSRVREFAILFGATFVVAAPWYALVSTRNPAFLADFIWKHHFGRFLESALQHGQPYWFYVPVLLAGIFPWTPLIVLLFQRKLYQDRRAIFLAAWLAWGFVFFSASRNKLPGYLLPVLPAAAALMGVTLAAAKSRAVSSLLAACGCLLLLVAPMADALPQALANGLSRTQFHLSLSLIPAATAFAAGCGITRRDWAVTAIGCFVAVIVALTIWRVYPQLDRELSGRATPGAACLPQTNRSQRYSLEYYAGRNLADCK
jgi:4-amino-4-deoxy-L-arabinose transferase-like glycosyltransferase